MLFGCAAAIWNPVAGACRGLSARWLQTQAAQPRVRTAAQRLGARDGNAPCSLGDATPLAHSRTAHFSWLACRARIQSLMSRMSTLAINLSESDWMIEVVQVRNPRNEPLRPRCAPQQGHCSKGLHIGPCRLRAVTGPSAAANRQPRVARATAYALRNAPYFSPLNLEIVENSIQLALIIGRTL